MSIRCWPSYHGGDQESAESFASVQVCVGGDKCRIAGHSELFQESPLEKFRSTEHYGAALEGSTIFLCRSSLGCTSMESCQLADLKYAIFSSTGCKTKKLPRSKLFLSMAFKHGLLDGSTFLFQYSSMTRAPLESSRLGELKYAISPG